MFLILIVAPLSGVTHQVFDIAQVDRTWWWRTWYDFFVVVGPYLCSCWCLIGVSLLFPQDSPKSYFLLPPLGIYIAKILWLWTVESNAEFHAVWPVVPGYFMITGAIIAFILIFTFNWLMSLHFHEKEGIIARIIGIILAKGLTPADQVAIARKEIKSLQLLQSKF